MDRTIAGYHFQLVDNSYIVVTKPNGAEYWKTFVFIGEGKQQFYERTMEILEEVEG